MEFLGKSRTGLADIVHALNRKGMKLSDRAFESLFTIFRVAQHVDSDVYSELALHGLIKAGTIVYPMLENSGAAVGKLQDRLLEYNRQAGSESWYRSSSGGKYYSASFGQNDWFLNPAVERALAAGRRIIYSSDLLFGLLEFHRHPDWADDDEGRAPGFEEVLQEFGVSAADLEKQLTFLRWVDPWTESLTYSLEIENNKFSVQKLNLFNAVPLLNPTSGDTPRLYMTRVTMNEHHPLFLPRELDEFEWLINNPVVSELELQRFFEKHPKFLLGSEYKALHSQLVLSDTSERKLIPDFFVERIDSDFADVIDLKKPNERLSSGPRNRIGFSRALTVALNQLREYRNYFDDRDNRTEFHKKYGLNAFRPQITVIIGRTTAFTQTLDFRSIMDEYKNLKVVTYDQLLAQARERALTLERSL